MHHLPSFKQASLVLLLAFACSSPAAIANKFSFSAATDFTTGKYGGTTSTDIWYAPFTARYDNGRASFRVIVPFLNITGPGNVLGPGIGGIDGRGTIIGGGTSFGGGNLGSGSGGGIVVCDETNDDCSGKNPGRSGNNTGSGGNSGSNGSAGGNSGSGGGGSDDGGNSGNGGGGSDDGGNSGSGGGGSDDGGNSGSGGGGSDDGGNSGNGGGSDDGGNSGSGSGGGGSDDGSNSGSGGGGGSGSPDDTRDQLRQRKISALGLTGGIPLGGSSLPSSTQSGLGDIITAFSYNLIDHTPSGIAFDITARLKIPTASANRNLGTGHIDYAVQGDLYKTISKFIFSATFGYRILGDPSGITFHNVFYGAAGAGYRLSENITLGTSYNMGQSPVRLQDSRDLSLYLSQRVSNNFRLNIYGLRGFSERSPDWGGGINLRYVF